MVGDAKRDPWYIRSKFCDWTESIIGPLSNRA